MKIISTEEVRNIGLVNKVVAKGELESAYQ